MVDPRVIRLADILVNHSLEIKEGERVLINAPSEAAPLVKEIYRKILQNGGIPITDISIPGLQKIFFEESNEKQLSDIEVYEMIYKKVDALVAINASVNTKELTNVDVQKMQTYQKSFQPIMDYILKEKVKWVGSFFPTNSLAQDAEMSLEEYEDFLFNATNIDYIQLSEMMNKTVTYFNQANVVRIIANQTDITIDIEGREAIVNQGKHNIPDGEFFFTPNYLLTEGTIFCEWPVLFQGRELQGLHLTFKDGKIFKYSADIGQDLLEHILNTDNGACYLGKLGIGTNPNILNPIKNILFDEKIGGSIHLAIGNASSINWNMVKNLKDNGEIYLDNMLVFKKGNWLL
ncbi:MAG: aminopeptidase [Vulcanibacillus sp.]